MSASSVAIRTRDEYGEVLFTHEAARFCGVSVVTFGQWLATGETPMGSLVEGVHYFRLGRQRRFIKHQLARLFKML